MTNCPHCGAALDAPPAKPDIPVHREARAAGYSDGLQGRAPDLAWPSGIYGHADYHLGYREGELARQEQPQ